MKLILSVISSLAIAAYADDDQFVSNSEKIAKFVCESKRNDPAFAEEYRLLVQNKMCGEGRSFGSGWASKMIDSINGYGCWCYFQEEHGKGRGQPANEVDESCKWLHDGYTCILLDSEAEGDFDCVPWDVAYSGATGLGVSAGDSSSLEYAIRRTCNKNNKKNKCGERSCKVESYFVLNLFKHFLAGVVFDPSLKHSLGFFNPKDDCPIKQGIMKSDKACCGEYPLRFPYKHLNGGRKCCNGSTYNAIVMQCCNDDHIKATC